MSEKENKEKENLETKVKYAKIILEKAEALKDYAASALMSHEQYGRLVQGFYESTASKLPDEETYERLFAPALLTKGASINQGYLQERSEQLLTESLSVLPVADALNYTGVKLKELDEKYNEKYVFQLPEEEMKELIFSYLTNLSEETIAKKIIPARAKQRTGNLEKIFAKKEEKN